MKLAYVDSSIWIARFEGLAKYRRKIDEELTRLAQAHAGASLPLS